MAQQVVLRSENQILGQLVRSILANTDLNDVTAGSTLATFLEAVAASQFQISTTALKILQSTNLEALSGQDLDTKAESIKLPNGIGGTGRKPAATSSGIVTIGSAFAKISTKLYAGKPTPFAGSSVIYLEDASKFPSTGSVYVARGTADRLEGPIAYTSVVNNNSYWTLNLATPLTKSHLISDAVTLAQGGDRVVPASTTVQIPANSESSAISYTTTQTLTIPDGESTGTVQVVCVQFGEVGNALAGAIKDFTTSPFNGATVTNTSYFSSGRSSESDEDLRQRIKSYPSTLSRGTSTAILAAIRGLSDPASGRTVKSAVALEPVEPGEFAHVYIDDGSGLEPTIDGQAYELLLQSASGQELRFRTAQFPITPPIVEGSSFGPFQLEPTDTITMRVDDVTEIYQITPSNYENLNSATAYELVRDMNAQSNIAGFRTADNGRRIIAIDISGQAEEIQVSAGTLQAKIGFPVSPIRNIFLYEDSSLISSRGKTAALTTRARNLWSLTEADLSNVIIIIDGVSQTITIKNIDFAPYNATIATATLQNWADLLSTKVAGAKFAVSGQFLTVSTYQTFSSTGKVVIPTTRADGTPAGWVGDTKIWATTQSGGVLSSTGNTKQFKFNRFTGEIALITKPAIGATIEVGSKSTRASVLSKKSPTGLFSLAQAPDFGNSRIIVSFDGFSATKDVPLPAGGGFTPSIPDSINATHIARLTFNNVDSLANLAVDDWMYLSKNLVSLSTWLPNVQGFYKIRRLGLNAFSSPDLLSSGLAAAPKQFTAVSAYVLNGSSTVYCNRTAHGLKTGDHVTINMTTAIGGISSSNLTVSSAYVIVTDDANFVYTAAATANSDGSGSLDQIDTNHILVTHATHGYKTGQQLTINSAVAIGNYTTTLINGTREIVVIDTNHYEIILPLPPSTVSTVGITGTTTAQSIANSWVEIELSDSQLADWTPLLSTLQLMPSKSIFGFTSTAMPQIIDFGPSAGSMTVDEIVTAINAVIVSGSAVKVSPRQFKIQTTNFDQTSGAAAVLSSIANAEAVISPASANSKQNHIAYVGSGYTGSGTPFINQVVQPTAPASGYATRTYLKTDKNLTEILPGNLIQAPTAIPGSYPLAFEHVWVSGRQAGLTARVYNNDNLAPYSGTLSYTGSFKPLNEASVSQTSSANVNLYSTLGVRLADMAVTPSDKLIAELDLDTVNKTVVTTLAKKAQILDIDPITSAGYGSIINFSLLDPDDTSKPFFDFSSPFRNYTLVDHKLLTKSVGVYKATGNDRALVLRSREFGGSNRLKFSIRYPSQPAQANIVVGHTTSYTDAANTNMAVTLASGPALTASTLASGDYSVTPTALLINLWTLRFAAAGAFNSGTTYAVNNLLTVAGSGVLSGGYRITNTGYNSYTSLSASATNGSASVVITQTAHGFQVGDLVNVSAVAAIGGISASSLSVQSGMITATTANTFTILTDTLATSTASGTLNAVSGGFVEVLAPSSAGLTAPTVYSAAQNTIRTCPLIPKTLQDIVTSITTYSTTYSIMDATAIGSNILTNYVTQATFESMIPASPYTSLMSNALEELSFACNMAGSAAIWQYDYLAPSKGIKATVQALDPIFPTAAQTAGTTYSSIGEEVYIVPTNSKTLANWLSFSATSSFSILGTAERTKSDGAIQMSTDTMGSAGAIHITGASGNSVSSFLLGNASLSNDAAKMTLLAADSKALTAGSLIKLANSVATEIQRPYRVTPTGTSVTPANTADITTFFRQTQSIKYIKTSLTTGRIIFLRNGMGIGQTEPLSAGNTITATSLGGGLVRLQGALAAGTTGTGSLSARVGDMMYVQSTPSMPTDWYCQELPSTGITDGSNPQYIGYPVVHVYDSTSIVVIAPQMSTMGVHTLTSSTDIVFLPAIWNEKNIRTNRAQGHRSDLFVNNAQSGIMIKALGGGFAGVWFQNSSAETTDNMALDQMSVGIDDYAVFTAGSISVANSGKYRIVAHNGRNMMIIYNPQAEDQIVEKELVSGGGTGSSKYGVSITPAPTRPIRVLASETVNIGDYLRISATATASQWFNQNFIGAWRISKIGFQGIDYTGALLPHTTSSGTPSSSHICPYIEITMPSAPVSIQDSVGAPVDSFLIGSNDKSIGFVEQTPFSCFRYLAGYAQNQSKVDEYDVFMLPNVQTSKMAATFGTKVTSLNKTSFSTQAYQGVDGYRIFTGLVQQSHRVIDGLPSNPTLYAGVRAAGTFIEVLPPLIKTVKVSLQIRPKDGITLNSITDLVKSTVMSYVNNVGVGQAAVLSEIIRSVQGLPGVYSVTIVSTSPAATDDRIVSTSLEKPFILSINDVIVG